MSKFKVGDLVKVIKPDVWRRPENFKVGEIVEVIDIDCDGDLYFEGKETNYLNPEQVVLVREASRNTIESRIEEMQARLDQIDDELAKLNEEEDKLANQIATLREAQQIMREV